MKLMLNQNAPDFCVKDVYGNGVSLDALKGRNIYLTFERNAGCPVCILRVHSLLKTAER
jgi:peroxiredoxin